MARQAFAAVHLRLQLEFTGHAVGVAKITQRRATQRQRTGQRLAHRPGEALAARAADLVAAGARVDAGGKQGLAGVDVARADRRRCRAVCR